MWVMRTGSRLYRRLASSLPGQVILPRVFLDHAVRGVLGHERHHGAPDPLDPAAGNALLIALEEERDDLLRQRFVKVRAIGPVLLLDRIGMRVLADGKAVGAVVAFAPPAVE